MRVQMPRLSIRIRSASTSLSTLRQPNLHHHHRLLRVKLLPTAFSGYSTTMSGKKRTLDGQIKPRNEAPAEDTSASNPTPPCAQPPVPSSKTTEPGSPILSNSDLLQDPAKPVHHPSKPRPKSKSKNRQKLPKLPSSTSHPHQHPQSP